MNPATQAEFARIADISRPMVHKLMKSELLTTCQVGSKTRIDLDGMQTQNYLLERKARLADDDNGGIDATAPSTRSPEAVEKKRLEIAKLKEQIQQIRIQNEQRRGNLVEKKLVEIVFGRIHAIDRDEWRALGVHMSGPIHAIYADSNQRKIGEILDLFGLQSNDPKKDDVSMILNTDDGVKVRLEELFEDHVGRVLQNVKRLISDFLQSLAADQGDDNETQEAEK